MDRIIDHLKLRFVAEKPPPFHMRQVGVRDEAKMVGGLGVCGRSLCCFIFMKSFEPVTIQKAKKQQIVINPTKISGLCGRLMCCLAFEDESLGRMYAEEEKVEED